MASIVKHTAKNGTVYVYENESYWDKEKKQPRSHRKLIGKIDPETGEMVPTGKRGPKKKSPVTSSADDMQDRSDIEKLIAEKDAEISHLRSENRKLAADLERLVSSIRTILDSYRA